MKPLRKNKDHAPKRRKDKTVRLIYSVVPRRNPGAKPIVIREWYTKRKDAEQALESFLMGRGMWNRSIWVVKDFTIE